MTDETQRRWAIQLLAQRLELARQKAFADIFKPDLEAPSLRCVESLANGQKEGESQ